jgi:RNA polymerase sigma-70 factor, ECF subfamily
MQDRDWILKTREGDPEAFSNLVRDYQARLRAFAARYVDNADDVYDLVQEAFLDAYRHLDMFDLERDFHHWLRGICRNRIRNFYRARKQRGGRAQSLVDDAIEDALGVDELSGERAADNAGERIAALKQCVGELQANHREVIQLRYYAGTPLRDIAAKLGQSDASIGMLLLRVRSTLMKCMERRSQVNA